MMDLNIQGGNMRINDDGSVAATSNIIKDIVDHYETSDGNTDGKKPEVSKLND